jgi:hypothetical protein
MSGTGVQLADQGCFWVGVTYEERDGQTVVDGSQLYVEFQKPQEQTQPYPVVLIHGGGGQGLDWMTTPDGRPGWRTLLLQRGRSASFEQGRRSTATARLTIRPSSRTTAAEDKPRSTNSSASSWPPSPNANNASST